MATRLTRPQQVERNRERVLEAAREVFTESGYVKATLDAIAERAGFSKGVVYSQFDGKADLFLALLEQRIAERAEQNRAITSDLATTDAIAALLRVGERDAIENADWRQVLIEFRTLATRDAGISRRYAELHARTIEELTILLDGIYARARTDPPVPTRTAARFVLALTTGVALERVASSDELPPDQLVTLITRALGLHGRTT